MFKTTFLPDPYGSEWTLIEKLALEMLTQLLTNYQAYDWDEFVAKRQEDLKEIHLTWVDYHWELNLGDRLIMLETRLDPYSDFLDKKITWYALKM